MTYNDIVNLTLGYADRQDDEVATRMDNFLRVTEARINRVLMTLDMSCLLNIIRYHLTILLCELLR